MAEQLALSITATREKYRVSWCAHHGPDVRFRLDAGRYRCVSCATAAVRESRRRYRLRLIAEFGGKCSRCGYDRSTAALEFHHRDSTTKSFEVNRGSGKSYELLREEALKCDLLCSNCHREVDPAYGD